MGSRGFGKMRMAAHGPRPCASLRRAERAGRESRASRCAPGSPTTLPYLPFESNNRNLRSFIRSLIQANGNSAAPLVRAALRCHLLAEPATARPAPKRDDAPLRRILRTTLFLKCAGQAIGSTGPEDSRSPRFYGRNLICRGHSPRVSGCRMKKCGANFGSIPCDFIAASDLSFGSGSEP